MKKESRVLAALIHHSEHKSGYIAVEGESCRVTYGELLLALEEARTVFKQAGIGKGDRVALCIEDALLHIIASLALLSLGACEWVLPRAIPEPDEETLAQAGISWRISLQKDVANVSSYLIETMATQTSSHTAEEMVDTCMLVLGSGTTGKPKLIQVTWTSLDEQIERDILSLSISDGDALLSLSPPGYYTAKRRILACFTCGGKLVLPPVQQDFFAYCRERHVSHLTMVRQHTRFLLGMEADVIDRPSLPDLKSILIGASPIPENIRLLLRRHLSPNTCIFYGPNEIGASCCTRLDEYSPVGTIGKPVAGIELEIVDAAGNICKEGETGEIRLRSSTLVDRYHVASMEQQSRSFRAGWFYPGDLAYRDREGHIIFQGRVDDMIIFQGNNIYPREIEMCLEQHSQVAECAVFGFETYRFGEVPIGAYVPLAGSDSRQITDELQTLCRSLKAKAPLLIVSVKQLPKNQAGKILKGELRKALFDYLVEQIRQLPG